MSNSSPQPPLPPRPTGEPQRRRRGVIDFDEAIAILIAFATIGSILFWSLARGKVNFSPRGWLSSNIEKQETDLNSRSSRVLSARTEADTAELTNKYLGQTPKLEVANQSTAIPRKARKKSFNPANIAAPVATGLVLTNPKTAKTETTPKKPPAKTEKTPPKADFKDLPKTEWYSPFVDQLQEKNLIAPSPNNLFEPDKLVTRAGMATLISEAFSLPNTEKIKKFDDVSSKNAIGDINKAVKTGFMKGYSDTEFRPSDNIPRYQVLVTLATGLDLKPSQDADTILSKFKDGSNMPDWAKDQVAAASEAGLIVNRPGTSKGSLNPEAKATRAEAAAMIHQALVKLKELKPVESEYIVNP